MHSETDVEVVIYCTGSGALDMESASEDDVVHTTLPTPASDVTFSPAFYL